MLFRTMTCPECGARMHLRRTRRRRTMEGHDHTSVWWDCDCGGTVTEQELDPVYRGTPLPRRRAVMHELSPARGSIARSDRSGTRHHQGRTVSGEADVAFPIGADGQRLVKVVVHFGDDESDSR